MSGLVGGVIQFGGDLVSASDRNDSQGALQSPYMSDEVAGTMQQAAKITSCPKPEAHPLVGRFMLLCRWNRQSR